MDWTLRVDVYPGRRVSEAQRRQIEAIARFFGVPPRYFLGPDATLGDLLEWERRVDATIGGAA